VNPVDPLENLSELNREIAELETESARLNAERAKLAGATTRAKRRHRYLRLARWFRVPKASFPAWPIFVLAVGPLLVGAITLILLDLILGTWVPMPVGFLIGAISGAGLFSLLLYRPGDELLPAAIEEAEAEWGMNQALLEDTVEQVAAVKERLKTHLDERREAMISGKLQRAALLQRNWKAMRDDEWEDYLVEVCRTLGAKAQRTGKCGDQGCDLIVEFGQHRIAVQAKGYYNAVNNKAVQEAFAGMRHRQCDSCAVITNSRFRKSATELASSTNCILIGEDEFPDFVMGKISLW
jgi:HJR/Mrr/RecB family endonuclease